MPSLPELRWMYESAKDGPGSDAAQIEMLANWARNDPASVASAVFQFPDALDIDGYDKAEMIDGTRLTIPDVCGNGIGHSHDNWLTLRPWGFSLEQIRVPTQLSAANTNDPYPLLRHAEPSPRQYLQRRSRPGRTRRRRSHGSREEVRSKGAGIGRQHRDLNLRANSPQHPTDRLASLVPRRVSGGSR